MTDAADGNKPAGEKKPAFLSEAEFARWGTGEMIGLGDIREGEIVEVSIRAELYTAPNRAPKLIFASHHGDGSMAIPARAIFRRVPGHD